MLSFISSIRQRYDILPITDAATPRFSFVIRHSLPRKNNRTATSQEVTVRPLSFREKTIGASSFQYFLAAHDIHAGTQTIQSLGNRHSCLHPHTGKQQKIFKSKTHSLHFLDQMHSPNIGLTICQNLPHENRPLAGSSGTNRK